MRPQPGIALCVSLSWFIIQALLIAADAIQPEQQAKLSAAIKQIEGWVAEPQLLSAVKAANANPDPKYAGMTQEQWKGLTVLDPLVRGLTKNPTADFLKSKRTEAVSEAFLSAADGTKIAYLSKPSNWSHKGKPKHEAPMSGKVWQGPVEVDESTGVQQVQVSVPVLEAGKPIGSLVVGLSISKLSTP